MKQGCRLILLHLSLLQDAVRNIPPLLVHEISPRSRCSRAAVLLDMLSLPLLFFTDGSSIPSLRLGKYLVLCTDYQKGVSKQTVKPGCKKAAVSGASLESDPGEKIVHHAACSMCNRGCCNYSLFGLKIDDSRCSESSSPPPLQERHNQRAECSLPSQRYAPSISSPLSGKGRLKCAAQGSGRMPIPNLSQLQNIAVQSGCRTSQECN